MSTFEAVIEKQHNLLVPIFRAFSNTKKLCSDKINRFTLNARIKNLVADWDRFQANHDKLIGSLTDENRKLDYFVHDVYAVYEEAYFDATFSLMLLRCEIKEPESTAPDAAEKMRPGSCRSLPKISLPKFTGNYHEWPSFRDLFESMIVSNQDITLVEKLHYLKSQVRRLDS